MDLKDVIQKACPNWEIVQILGSGSYGSVFSVQRRDIVGVTRAAIKVVAIPHDASELNQLRSEGLSDDESRTYVSRMVRDFAAEVRVMESVKGHTNIVSIEDLRSMERATPKSPSL